MPKRIKRSTFLKGLAGLTIASAFGKYLYDFVNGFEADYPVKVLGPSRNIGHLIRDGRLNKPDEPPEAESCKVVIVGGGISGLSAGWWFKKNGFDDFKILELESGAGGNSNSGENTISAYPWGAHYVPLANEESVYVRQFFEEVGVIERFDQAGMPVYNELFLCHDPEERLFKDGQFEEGLVPKRGLHENDKKEIKRFFEIIVELRNKTGSDGKKVFTIPLDLSSQDKEFLELDKISMAQWLDNKKFESKPLLWYVDYCCRDDYGAGIDKVSAWAGLHYYSGRRGRAANADQNSVVTWPEGNGFLVGKLKDLLQNSIRPDACVFKIEQADGRVKTNYIDAKTKEVKLLESDYLIFSAPRFVSKYIIDGYQEMHKPFSNLKYPPWMVANISLKRLPYGKGISSAWDNVRYRSDSLGYVLATHQSITTRQKTKTVITYYYPLVGESPDVARARLLNPDTGEWKKIILDDLKIMHPYIEKQILSIELWPWGHGMISPSIDFLWSETRKKMKERFGNVFFAHSDMSGISNFEESQYRGVRAASEILDLKQNT